MRIQNSSGLKCIERERHINKHELKWNETGTYLFIAYELSKLKLKLLKRRQELRIENDIKLSINILTLLIIFILINLSLHVSANLPIIIHFYSFFSIWLD